jgi:hypothetical protein
MACACGWQSGLEYARPETAGRLTARTINGGWVEALADPADRPRSDLDRLTTEEPCGRAGLSLRFFSLNEMDSFKDTESSCASVLASFKPPVGSPPLEQ